MKLKIPIFIDLIVIGLLLLIPYYVFGGKLFIGGDDTRLFYVYPMDWIKNVAFFSWFHLSTVSINNPNQFIIPFLLIPLLLQLLIPSKVVIDYLFFSLPIILGFIFYQKFISEFVDDNKYQYEVIISAMFYIMSPIILINQLSIFLYSVWLIGGVPLLFFLLIRYIKTGNKNILLLASITLSFLAIVFVSIPWFLGVILSAVLPLVFIIKLIERKEIVLALKRSIEFFGAILLTQAFWIIPFVLNFLLIHKGTFASSVLSAGDTFSPTVLATATGNILYPMLNLFHRKIAFDYNWPLAKTFLTFYDKIWYVNLSFVVIIVASLFSYKKYLPVKYRVIYLYSLIAFVLSLFFFTVNIDILKDIFLIFGKIPGFVMFRNFYDKFALGFVFQYSFLFAISLIIFNAKYRRYRFFANTAIFLIIILGALPIKDIINKPLWTTRDTYTVSNLPSEYIKFVNKVGDNVKTSANLLSLPYNIAAYSFIRDENSNNIYVGTSPMGIFTGINDFSGDLSFPGEDATKIKDYLVKHKYNSINQILEKYAINYIFVTDNVPKEIKSSYLFYPEVIKAQNKNFLTSITGNLLLSSSHGNYKIYSVKDPVPVISGLNVIFKKLSPVRYQIKIKNLKDNEKILFRDTYNYDWKLYPEKNIENCTSVFTYTPYRTSECASTSSFNLNELTYIIKKPLPESYHSQNSNFGNMWELNYSYIKNKINSSMYTVNKDGSINITFTLYFLPQTYFYLGTIISIITIICLVYITLIQYRREK